MSAKLLRSFEWSIRALAQPAEGQLLLYPAFVCHADELALEFEQYHRAIHPMMERMFVPAQIHLLKELDRMLESMSGQAKPSLWTEQALRQAPEWERVRKLARRILAAVGWPDGPPPLERGDIYVV